MGEAGSFGEFDGESSKSSEFLREIDGELVTLALDPLLDRLLGSPEFRRFNIKPENMHDH